VAKQKGAPTMPDRPNIVLINVDQWRGDCLSVSGHPVVQTPYLDRMALGGARFNRAYSATPTCIPARAALYTGQTQRTHGRVGYQDGVTWNYPVTIASEFTRHGYQTQAVGKLHVYPERSQMGFQNVILHDGYLHFARKGPRDYGLVDDYTPWLREQLGRDCDYTDDGLECNSVVARPWDKPEHVHPSTFIVTQSIDFLRRRDPRKPFFLYMSFHRPHPPYDPPAWAFEQYINQKMPDPPVGAWSSMFADRNRPFDPACLVGKIDPRLLQRARAGYYGHMTHIDQLYERFRLALWEHGQLENTYFLFVSDHGEMMGDHDFFRKGIPYEGSARVPLIFTGPKGGGIKPNAAYDSVVELRDVMPTLLDCAGLPIPESVEGKSFLPMVRGEKQNWREYLHGEHAMFEQSVQWLTDGKEKYVWFSGTGAEQLFDLKEDPCELNDLSKSKSTKNRLEHWRVCLMKELHGREEGFTDGKKLITGRPVVGCLKHVRTV
jgi:arylsulfatase A-like enzyme